jgi:hypothetical protein
MGQRRIRDAECRTTLRRDCVNSYGSASTSRAARFARRHHASTTIGFHWNAPKTLPEPFRSWPLARYNSGAEREQPLHRHAGGSQPTEELALTIFCLFKSRRLRWQRWLWLGLAFQGACPARPRHGLPNIRHNCGRHIQRQHLRQHPHLPGLRLKLESCRQPGSDGRQLARVHPLRLNYGLRSQSCLRAFGSGVHVTLHQRGQLREPVEKMAAAAVQRHQRNDTAPERRSDLAARRRLRPKEGRRSTYCCFFNRSSPLRIEVAPFHRFCGSTPWPRPRWSSKFGPLARRAP